MVHVMYNLNLNAIMSKKKGKTKKAFSFSMLLQNESIMFVSNFTWPLKIDNVKNTRVVRQVFDKLHLSFSSKTKHANLHPI